MAPSEQARTTTVLRSRRLKWILAAIIIAAIVVVAGFALVVPGPKAQPTVTDGSITGTIQGDFSRMDYDNSSFSYFNATTYARQQGHPNSTITLQLVTITRWTFDYDYVETAFLLTVLGEFDANLSARNIQVVCNQTAYHTSVDDMETTTKGTNVIFDPREPVFEFWDNSSGTLTAKLINREGSDPLYKFSYSNTLLVWSNQIDNLGVRFFGIRVIVNGWFEPEFSVGMLIKIVNTYTPD